VTLSTSLATVLAVAVVSMSPARAYAADPDPAAAQPTAVNSFWTPRTRLATELLIGSALAAGAGVAFGLASESEHNSAAADYQALGPTTTACYQPSADHVGPCSDLRNSLTAQNSFVFAEVGAYVAAGGLFLSAVATYFLWPQSRENQAAVLPYANPASRSAGVVIAF
jgi:hypothetical protein